MSSIGFECLNVRYGEHEAVYALTDHVRPGEWLCLIGPNGAGKSSVLRAVAGLVPYRGAITVDGTPLADRSPRRRAALVAYVPQSPLMPDDMTGLEYVLLGRNPYIGYFGSESKHDRALVADVLHRLDLHQFAGRRLGSLSGGERQRLVIARAVAQEAPVLLLDEPTSALDIGHQQQALELVDRLRHDHGLVGRDLHVEHHARTVGRGPGRGDDDGRGDERVARCGRCLVGLRRNADESDGGARRHVAHRHPAGREP